MVLCDNQFLSELMRLFEESQKKDCGTVVVTLKGLSAIPKKKSKTSKSKNPGMRCPIDETQGKPACLYRATLGSRKISTVVSFSLSRIPITHLLNIAL
eukprot:gene3013-5797_t